METLVFYLRQASDRGYIGETVSQLEHALQCAHLAFKDKVPQWVIIAALLHDIGHLCPDLQTKIEPNNDEQWGIINHDEIGAEVLRKLHIKEKICNLVGLHAKAKRYLAYDVSYYDKLTRASKETLLRQGGPMTIDEIQEFELNTDWEWAIKLRRWDDIAKNPNAVTPPLEAFVPILKKQFI